MHLLGELYSIHFYDRTVYVNCELIGYKNSRVLLEILCHLIEVY
jgi:hypothetical protein